ncbi:PQQ-binding-like beta-propeller repeat protein [Actinomadura verrucosospora]|uniref:outer membrane protein assembly factor BamB family protein n=1 Tax=Actinomadura verrucosospora TaxID=46165 RepID=UPI001FE2F91E|nr:PQQ-binding-like beta-propeller repeat protein [Actinomadura verrucosospora]
MRAVGVVVGCALVSGCVSANSPTKTPSAAPVVTTGPAPGHWHAAWTRTFASGSETGGIRDVALAGGVLVAASAQGVEALDARTGATRWRSGSFDRSGVAALAVSGEQVVIATRGGRWIGVQAATGRVSWRSRPPSGGLIPYYDKLQSLAGSAVLPVVSVDNRTIRGVDGRTGRIKWSIGRQQLYGCSPDVDWMTRSGSVETKRYVSGNWLAVPVTCGTRKAVVAVDAASGRAAWRHDTVTPDDSPQSAASDRFVGINDAGYGVFERGVRKGAHSLIVEAPSGRVTVALEKAQSYDTWGPLSPLASANGSMVLPIVRGGKHYFSAMASSGSRGSILGLAEEVSVATFDGARVYEVRKDGSIDVATVGRLAPVAVRPGMKGYAFWVAAGNNTLFVATSEGRRGGDGS